MIRRSAAAVAIAAGLAITGSSVVGTSASAQDLFSLLFGSPPRHYGHVPPRSHEPSYRAREQRGANYDPVLGGSSVDYGLAGANLGGRDPLYSMDPADQGMLKMFLTDRTLTRGDIVVTKTGFRVFRGSSSFPHSPSDFVPLQAANLRNLAQLMALEATVAPPVQSPVERSDDQPKTSGARSPLQPR
jgi:hypothetical protein